jgi:hypothetical protein
MRRPIAATLALIVAACQSPSASSGPSGQAVPSPGASAVGSAPASAPPPSDVPPSTEPSPSPQSSTPPSGFAVIPPGAAIEVRVAELNLRKQPSTSAGRVKVLERGNLLVVSPSDPISLGHGPVQADGYTWYPVIEVDVVDGDGELDPLPANPILIGAEQTAGWVATDDGRDSFVRQVGPRCPTTVDLVNVSAMLPAERLACFGAPIVLEGTFGCGGCGGAHPGEFRPGWLADSLNFNFLSEDVTETFGPLAIRFAPSGPARPADGSIIRVTLHVDDARAARCRISELDSGPSADVLIPVPRETAVYYCREQLVVDSYEVLGTDPDFRGG